MMFCLPPQVAGYKYLLWWSFYIPVACNFIFHQSQSKDFCIWKPGFGVCIDLSFCDNHFFFSFLWTHFPSPITMWCKNEKLVFLIKRLWQIGEEGFWFSSENSWRTHILLLYIFPVCLGCAVKLDILSFCTKSLVLWHESNSIVSFESSSFRVAHFPEWGLLDVSEWLSLNLLNYSWHLRS